MKQRPILTLFLIGLVLAAVGFAAGPWLAFRSLRSAARFNDLQALAEVVDYNAVRASLSAQLRPTDVAQTAPAPDILHDPIGAIRRAMQPPPAPRMDVDIFLTPSALTALTAGRDRGSPAPNPEPRVIPQPRYWAADRTRLAVPDPARPGRETLFTFQRKSWFGWKLVGIGLPGPVPAA